MINKKTNLQRHQVAAFKNTLALVALKLENKISFIEEYGPVYHFPARVMRDNLREYKRLLKAARELEKLKI